MRLSPTLLLQPINDTYIKTLYTKTCILFFSNLVKALTDKNKHLQKSKIKVFEIPSSYLSMEQILFCNSVKLLFKKRRLQVCI